MKLRLPRILAEEDEEDQPPAAINESTRQREARAQPSPTPWGWLGTIIATALVTRLGYLFFFTDPQNAGDGFTDRST